MQRINRQLILVSLCVLFFSLSILPAEKLAVTQRRAHYFILKPQWDSNNPIKKGRSGTLYNDKNAKPLGTFQVLEVWQGKCLCLMDSQSLQNGTETNQITLAALDPLVPTTTAAVKNPLHFSGKRFSPLKGKEGFFLTEEPVPLQSMIPPDISGIKNLLFSIEKQSGHRYSANMIALGQINRLGLRNRINFADPDILLLGTVEGKPCMIYDEEAGIRHTELSADTMKKFQKDLHVYILLKRKTIK